MVHTRRTFLVLLYSLIIALIVKIAFAQTIFNQVITLEPVEGVAEEFAESKAIARIKLNPRFNDGSLKIITRNLPQLLAPQEEESFEPHFYEAWLIASNASTSISVGAFNVRKRGNGIVEFDFKPSSIRATGITFGEIDKIQITAEPQDGDSGPATVILEGKVN